MLKIRTFILALTVTPLLAINWQLPSQSQTSPSVGTGGSLSGGGNVGPVNTSPSVGTGGSLSGGGSNGTSGNTVSNPNPSVGTAGGQSGGGTTGSNGNSSVGTAGGQSGGGTTGTDGDNVATDGGQGEGENNASNGNNEGNENNDSSGPVENLVPRASSISILRGRNGNIIRIKIDAQRQINTTATNLLNGANPGILVAIAQGGTIGQTASDTFTEFLIGAGVNPELGGSFAAILRSIIVQTGDNQANVDINQLNNAINTYNRIVRESSPVTLQTLSQNEDFATFGSALRELRAAVQ